MFGDSMFEEEERLRRAAESQADGADDFSASEQDDLMAMGGLDEHIRRRLAITQLLREVGGC